MVQKRCKSNISEFLKKEESNMAESDTVVKNLDLAAVEVSVPIKCISSSTKTSEFSGSIGSIIQTNMMPVKTRKSSSSSGSSRMRRRRRRNRKMTRRRKMTDNENR